MIHVLSLKLGRLLQLSLFNILPKKKNSVAFRKEEDYIQLVRLAFKKKKKLVRLDERADDMELR